MLLCVGCIRKRQETEKPERKQMMHCGSKMAADYYGIMVGVKRKQESQESFQRKKYIGAGSK